MVVDRDREHLFRMILANDVVVENLADFLRGRNSVARFHQRGLVLLADDVHAKLDALIADEDGRPGNQLAHLMLALAAERAIEGILGIAAANLAHSSSPSVRHVRMCVPVGVAASITTAPLRLRSINVIHPVFFARLPSGSRLAALIL